MEEVTQCFCLCWGLNLRPHGSRPTSLTTRPHPWEVDGILGCESFGEKHLCHFSVLSWGCFPTFSVVEKYYNSVIYNPRIAKPGSKSLTKCKIK